MRGVVARALEYFRRYSRYESYRVKGRLLNFYLGTRAYSDAARNCQICSAEKVARKHRATATHLHTQWASEPLYDGSMHCRVNSDI